jgi:hypothetical protein
VRAALLFLAGATVACVGPVPPHEVRRLSDAAIVAAEGHLEDGNPSEAAELLGAVLAANPDDLRAREIYEWLATDTDSSWAHPYLGMNYARRAEIARPLWARVLLYLPDRLLDLTDVLSLDLHLGPLLYGNVHLTRVAQVGAGARGVTGFGLHERRSLGMRDQVDSGLTLMALGADSMSTTLNGTSGIFGYAGNLAGLHQPWDEPYQQIRDYWALGGALTVIFVGIDLDLHPLQIADFLAGWLTVDFLNDDFARTRSLLLSRYERELMSDLAEVARRRAR